MKRTVYAAKCLPTQIYNQGSIKYQNYSSGLLQKNQRSADI